MRPCPFCAEQIQDAAVICRYCNRDLPSVSGRLKLKLSAPVHQKDLTPFQILAFLTIGLSVVGLFIYGLALMDGTIPTGSRAARPTIAPASTPSLAPATPSPTISPRHTTPTAPAPPAAQANSSTGGEQTAKRNYTPAQTAAARGVMEKVRGGLATFDDDGRSLDVHFAYGLLPGMDREQVYQLIEAIANADAVLTGQARLILFYDPTGKRVGKASGVSGITVDVR